jgi:hypothetical protein
MGDADTSTGRRCGACDHFKSLHVDRAGRCLAFLDGMHSSCKCSAFVDRTTPAYAATIANDAELARHLRLCAPEWIYATETALRIGPPEDTAREMGYRAGWNDAMKRIIRALKGGDVP